MSYAQNDHLNRRLFAVIFDAQLAHELSGNTRRAVLKKARVGKIGQLARVLDRVLAMDDAEMDRFFERVMGEYRL